jgi:hypothetical protein
MDLLDYLNQQFQYKDFVKDQDIETRDTKDDRGNIIKTKFYTFRTEKFGTFTTKIIN